MDGMQNLEPIDKIAAKWNQRAAQWEALSEDEKERRLDVQRQEWEAERRHERDWRIETRLRKIPPRFKDAVCDLPEAQQWVGRFFENRRCDGLLICGPTGVGKTRLMWGIYRAVVEADGPDAEVVKLVSMLSALRPGGDAPPDLAPRLARVPLLCIDDVGAQKSSEWVEERLYEVIDTRYDAALPTILTTNRRPDKLDEVIGPRLASRLAELCSVLTLTGPDRRRS